MKHALPLKHKNQRGFGLLGLIVIGLLLLAIPFGIYMTRTQQLNKSKAFQPAPISAPDLSITLVSDKGIYQVGDNVRVAVYVRNEIEAANLYVVKLKFPTDLLNFVSLDKSPSSSFVQTWTEELVDNTTGSVSLVTELQNLAGSGNSGYRSPANQQYGAKLADLNFTAKEVGVKQIIFDTTTVESSAIYSAASNTNVLHHTLPATITVENVITLPSSPVSSNGPQFCLDVLTPAKNPTTGECVVYPNSCIPEGWVREKCDQNSRNTPIPTSSGTIVMCKSVLTPGYNPTTKECQVFSNSCLPTGWVRQSCPEQTASPSATVIPIIYKISDPKGIAPDYDILNIADLSGIKSRYNLTTTEALKADLNGDGVVNNFDRSKLLCALGANNSIKYSCN